MRGGVLRAASCVHPSPLCSDIAQEHYTVVLKFEVQSGKVADAHVYAFHTGRMPPTPRPRVEQGFFRKKRYIKSRKIALNHVKSYVTTWMVFPNDWFPKTMEIIQNHLKLFIEILARHFFFFALGSHRIAWRPPPTFSPKSCQITYEHSNPPALPPNIF